MTKLKEKWLDFCYWVRGGNVRRVLKRLYWRAVPHQCKYRMFQDRCKLCGRRWYEYKKGQK